MPRTDKQQSRGTSAKSADEAGVPDDSDIDTTTKKSERQLLSNLADDEQRAQGRRYILLYAASAIVIVIVFAATLLPEFIAGSDILYNVGSLTILYAALSLAAAMITFGVIGDSGALINVNRSSSSLVQIGGSAAGFVIFYYLLSSGLNPYKDLDIYLYNDKGQLMRPADGSFEVTLASRISQSNETSNGHSNFSVPRSESNIRVFVNSVSGRLWALDHLTPNDCVDKGNRIAIECDSINAHLVREKRCLSDYKISSYEVKEIKTNLKTVLDTLKENLQNISSDLPVHLKFSDSVVERKLHEVNFELERKNETARSICEHMTAIENALNWSIGKQEIKSYLSCNTMQIALTKERIGEEYEPCL